MVTITPRDPRGGVFAAAGSDRYHHTIVHLLPLQPDGAFGRFAAELLRGDFPALSEPRLCETVDFVCRRSRDLPGPLRAGVVVLSLLIGAVAGLVGVERVTRFMRSTPLPLVGELARMVRSLGVAFIWESWPDTGTDGSDRSAVVAR